MSNLQEAFNDLNSLNVEDLKKIGTGPLSVKIAVAVFACAFVCGLIWWLMVLPTQERLSSLQRQEISLKQAFEEEQARVANLEAYRAQLDEMRESLVSLLRQLPNKTDVESLLIDLSQASVASGLRVEYLKPRGETPQEFYAEYPIDLSVTGDFHAFGQFVSSLAALSRIVTLSDIRIAPENEENSAVLKMQLTATTYRYLEEDAE